MLTNNYTAHPQHTPFLGEQSCVLSTNYTGMLQPLHWGTIKYFKQLYSKHLI